MNTLQDAGVDWGASGQILGGLSALPPVETLLTTLLNVLNNQNNDHSRLLILDDYHKIHNATIHAAIQFWLDHAPPHLHLVIITREDPPLTLARWRVRDQMTEIRVADLRFTIDETAVFLNQTMGLNLTAADISALERRTEGWIAGLQLAAIALQSPTPSKVNPNSADFIAAFSGSHHYVIDYLLEEVLKQQDTAVSSFLQQTAVLERLTPALCDAVTQRDDSTTILTHLEQSNLFLIPLDTQHQWFRYHHLFADSLRAGLDTTTQATLHQRAARWYAENGQPQAAVRHALASGDLPWAADMMARVIQQASAWSRGQVGQLTGWLDALPAPLLQERPALSLHASRALYLAGQLDRSEQLVQQAEAALYGRSDPHSEELHTLATVYHAAISTVRGTNLDASIDAMYQLLPPAASMNLHTAARAADTLGLAYELSGDVTAAIRAYLQASDLAHTAGVRFLAVNARCEAAMMQIRHGQLSQAQQSCQQALALAENEAIPPTGLAHAVLGEIARERNDLATAEKHLLNGIELSLAGGILGDLPYSYLFLARLRQAQGDGEAAIAAWQQADLILQAYNVPRMANLSATHRARFDLAQGNLILACHWAETYQQQRETAKVEYTREVADLTLARVLLANRQPDAALKLIQAIIPQAKTAVRGRTVIEALILEAVALAEMEETVAAATSLTHAVSRAAPERFLRLFLDEGTAVAALLPRVRAAAPTFVNQLLAGFEESLPEQPPSPAPLLLDPLSEREQEVLALLVAGLSNREIAEQLVITVGTTKWHVHNIYEKLGVNGRAQAIARAHARGLA